MISSPVIVTFTFFLVLLCIAAWGLRNTDNVGDFFLGGQKLGAWILAVSYGATYFSAVIFVGFAGQFGWKFGLHALWVGIGNAIIGGGLAWLVLGKRTRRMTRNLGAMTMPEFFAARYGSNGMKVISALIIFTFLLPYTASVFKGLAYLFEITFGSSVTFETMLTVITVVCFLYVTFGGYKAVARIDFIQGGVMFVGSILMTYILVSHFGGIGEVLRAVPLKIAERMATPENDSLRIAAAPWYLLPAVVFMTSFGVWGLPQMIHKFYAISDESEIWRGAVITTVFALVIGGAAYITGAMTHLMPVSDTFPPLKNGAVDFDKLIPDLINSKLPQLLMSLILLLVLSASMSTLSSLVLVSASAVTIDLYKGYVNPNTSKRNELWLMRTLCGLFIVFAYVIALKQPSWIVTLMSLSWGSVAGAFLAPYIYGLYWRRTTKPAAYAGIITGLLISNGTYLYVLYGVSPNLAQMLSPVIASAAMIVPFVVVPVVSLFTKPPKEEILNLAFGKSSAS
ncbi:MAG: sodium:solute symporter family protein [Planctomycetaceae bacterium]|nr:sodium:solute symporter family protein [Planctomycetaceae bacterium]